jgi:hypothetical protein
VGPKPRSERPRPDRDARRVGPDVAKSRAASEARFAQAVGERRGYRDLELIADDEVADEYDDDAPETERQSQVPLDRDSNHDFHQDVDRQLESGAVGSSAVQSSAVQSSAVGSSAEAEAFGLPRRGGVAKLPLANLQMPSSPRLDLTPSPVPRVALSPATGSVDISLVPGPYASRNLPTLAAHHALGRRQPRRPAPARTLPPPGRGSREPRLAAGLAKDVRSSKREIVLGLTIGLGMSLVLAAIGQSYLRSDPIANGSGGQDLESTTLSARPSAAEAGMLGAAGLGAAGSRIEPAELERSRAEASQEPKPALAIDGASALESTHPSAASFDAASVNSGSVTAGGAHPKAARRSGAGNALVSTSGAHGSSASSGHAARAASAPDLPPSEAGKSPEEASPARARMSPAESAGLGLDLPL